MSPIRLTLKTLALVVALTSLGAATPLTNSLDVGVSRDTSPVNAEAIADELSGMTSAVSNKIGEIINEIDDQVVPLDLSRPTSGPEVNRVMKMSVKGRAAFKEGKYDDALHLLSLAANDSQYPDPVAQLGLFIMYAQGAGVPQNYDTAVYWLEKSIQKLDGMSEFAGQIDRLCDVLKRLHELGMGVKSCDSPGFADLSAAAKSGKKLSQFSLGMMLFLSDDPNVQEEAGSWFKKSADAGCPLAQAEVGQAYLNGIMGFPHDSKLGFAWTEKAALTGLASAQSLLGLCYYKGSGVTTNRAEALKWFQMGASQGDMIGEYYLAILYQKGGPSTNDTESLRYCRMAAEQGLSPAQYKLGFMLEKGIGCSANLEEAIRWYTKSASHGDERARRALSRLNKGLESQEGQPLR